MIDVPAYVSLTSRDFDPDRPMWERQAAESDAAWAAFTAYLRSEKRRVGAHGPRSSQWAQEWAWAARVHEWDNHLIHEEYDLQVRMRIDMNERHRRIARASLGKVASWLAKFDESKMTAAEATRLMDIASRLEREANGGTSAVTPPVEKLGGEPLPDDVPHEGTLQERAVQMDLSVDLHDLARLLHKQLPGS